VLLTRRFRLPAYVNGHSDRMLVETAAGLLDGDGDAPAEAIRQEAVEETGHIIGALETVFDIYLSPGSATECLRFSAAPYEPTPLAVGRHGITAGGEDTETLELPVKEALAQIRSGNIADAKTIMLLQWAVLDGPSRHPGRLVRGEAP
jgi:nudix-type nucleoside diphosphatase (YffH/AdpP family)